MMRRVAMLALACLASQVSGRARHVRARALHPAVRAATALALPRAARPCPRWRAAGGGCGGERATDEPAARAGCWQASGASCHVSPAGRAGLKVLRLRGGATGTAAFEQALQSNDAGAVSDAVDKILGVKLPRENLRGGERPEPPFRGGARGEAEFRLSQAIESNDPYAFEAAVGLALARMPHLSPSGAVAA